MSLTKAQVRVALTSPRSELSLIEFWLTGVVRVLSIVPLVAPSDWTGQSGSRGAIRHAGDFADLVVTWQQEAPITVGRSPHLGTLRSRPARVRTGNHRQGGWLVVNGPGITPAVLEQEIAVTDLAPTIAALFGITLSGVQGSPIPVRDTQRSGNASKASRPPRPAPPAS